MTAQAIAGLEQRFNLSLPGTYKDMLRQGHLTPGVKYLWLFEAEWLTPHAIAEAAAELPFISPLIPFAITGAHDHWCWDPASCRESLPVVMCPRDSLVGTRYAPSFEGFLFRRCLDYASGGYDDVNEARRQIAAWVSALTPYLPASWIAVLGEIVSRKEQTYRSGKWQGSRLVEPAEVKTQVKAAWNWPDLDSEVQWQR